MKKRSRGFTLIELLVAITVLAVVAVLGWRGLDAIVRSRVSLNEDLEYTRGLQLAFAQMQSDCGNIVKADAIGQRSALSAQPGRLALVRTVFADNQPSRVQVITYRLNGGVLSRSESVPTRDLKELDTAWSASMADASTAPPVVLHSGVAAMTVRTWSEGIGWRPAGADATPSPGVGAPATTGLEVSLQLQNVQSNLVKVFLLGAA